MNSIWQANLHLTDWAFVFAFPTDSQSFEQSHAWNFCVQFNNWQDYQSQVLNAFNDLIVPMERKGLAIYRRASLGDFKAAARSRKAVILFSHHEERMIEFRAGLVPFRRVLAAMPNGFEGIFEMSCCSPTMDMVYDIKQRFPNCGVPFMKGKIIPNTWIIYYAQLLCEFYDAETTFMAADTSAREKIRLQIGSSMMNL